MTNQMAQLLCDIIMMVDKVQKTQVEHGTKLDSIMSQQGRLVRQGTKIMATLDDLVAKEAAEGDAIDRIIALLVSVQAELAAAGQDPVKLQALSDSIDAHLATLNAAAPPTP